MKYDGIKTIDQLIRNFLSMYGVYKENDTMQPEHNRNG